MAQPAAPARPRLRAYPTYRDSGVAWIGRVPAHWEVSRTKRVARLRTGHTPSRQHPEYWENCTIPWFGLADVWQIRDGMRNVVTETAEKISELGLANSAARLLPKGTVIVSRTASVGFSAVLGMDMATTQDFVNWVCGPRIRPEYLLQVFRSMRQEFARLTMGSTHQTIYMPDVGQFSTPVPPIGEQQAIAAFLDRETARIDALAAKNERMIQLLDDEFEARVTAVVTHGLAPAVRQRATGVEWIGAMPAHWDVAPIKRMTKFINGAAFKPSDWSERGTPIIRIENLNGGGAFNFTQRVVDTRYHVQHGDLLFGWSGNRGTSFGPFLWRRSGLHYLNQHIFKFAGFTCHRTWFYWALRGATDYVEKQAHGIIGMVHITRPELGKIMIPVPPMDEQVAIADALERDRERRDAMKRRIGSVIDRLREYRAALITAAVTGQIDVRGEVAA